MSKQFKVTLIVQVDFEDINTYWLEDLLRDFIHEQNGLLVERISSEEIYK